MLLDVYYQQQIDIPNKYVYVHQINYYNMVLFSINNVFCNITSNNPSQKVNQLHIIGNDNVKTALTKGVISFF